MIASVQADILSRRKSARSKPLDFRRGNVGRAAVGPKMSEHTLTQPAAQTELCAKIFRRSFAVILIVAVVLRVAWAVAVPVIPISDGHAYDTFAQNLASGDGYGWEAGIPGAYWPVGLSFVYSLFYRVFGHTYTPIVIFNIIVGVLTIVLTIEFTRRQFGPPAALLAGGLMAAWPSQIEYVTVLASELPFTCLVVGAILLWTLGNVNLWARAVLVGVLLAAASYIRPTAILLPFAFAFGHALRKKQLLKPVAAVCVIIAVMALLIAPWTARNMRAFGRFVLISTNGGVTLWMGNNPLAPLQRIEGPLPGVQGMSEVEREVHLKEEAIVYIKKHPVKFVVRSARKLVLLHSRETISVHFSTPLPNRS